MFGLVTSRGVIPAIIGDVWYPAAQGRAARTREQPARLRGCGVGEVVLGAGAPRGALRGVPGVEPDALLLRPLLQRRVAGHEAVVGAGVPQGHILPGWQDTGPDACTATDLRADRDAEFDLEVSGHIDDEVADEGRGGDGNVLPGQPSE